ncbi:MULTISPECIES: hypothetical protein [unclassified Streptomyces]|uniref:hypothetical protein n=1 Tax=unclassified Streptomyces TaxID=2593676 RepID=UPI00336ABA1E
MDELRQALRRDPRTCLPHRFARAYFLAITDRPLLRGFLLDDPDLLGKLTSSPDTARDERHTRMAGEYFQLLAEHGLLRDDMGVDEIGYAYQATFEGFLRAEGAADRRADLLARTVRRAFESESAVPDAAPRDDAALRDIAAATVALLTDLIDADRAESGIPQD